MVPLFIVASWIYLAGVFRRFHDQNKSGVYVLLNAIPLIGPLIVFYFLLLQGSVTENNRFRSEAPPAIPK